MELINRVACLNHTPLSLPLFIGNESVSLTCHDVGIAKAGGCVEKAVIWRWEWLRLLSGLFEVARDASSDARGSQQTSGHQHNSPTTTRSPRHNTPLDDAHFVLTLISPRVSSPRTPMAPRCL